MKHEYLIAMCALSMLTALMILALVNIDVIVQYVYGGG